MEDPVAVERRPMGAGSVKHLVDRLSKDLAQSSARRRPTARVRYSYTPKHEDELELRVAELIDVLGEGEEGWLKGRSTTSGKIGLFPSNFCEVTPADESTTPLNSSADDLNHDSSQSSEIQPKKVKGVGFGVDILSGVKLRPSSQRFPAPDEKKEPPEPAKTSRDLSARGSSTSNGNGVDIASNTKGKDEFAKVDYAYKACNEDELELKEGEVIRVLNKDSEDPGWWYGEVGGRRGVFPDNFVTIVPAPPATPTPPAVPAKPKPSAKDEKPSLGASGDGWRSVGESGKTTTPPVLPSKAVAPASFAAKRDNLNSLFAKRPPSALVDSPPLTAAASIDSSVASETDSPRSQRHVLEDKFVAESDSEKELDIKDSGLAHPNLSRPKQQNKRPPSKVFLSEMSTSKEDSKRSSLDAVSEARAPTPPSSGPPAFPASALKPTPAPASAASPAVSSGELSRLRADLESFRRDSDARIRDFEARIKSLEAKLH